MSLGGVHLVTDEVYLWPWMLSTERRFVEITGSSNEIVKSCSGSDLPSTHRLKSLVREILLSNDVIDCPLMNIKDTTGLICHASFSV